MRERHDVHALRAGNSFGASENERSYYRYIGRNFAPEQNQAGNLA